MSADRCEVLPAGCWVRVETAAAFLDCSKRHVHALIRAGALRVADIAKPGAARPRWRVCARSLRDFLEARAVRARVSRSIAVARSVEAGRR